VSEVTVTVEQTPILVSVDTPLVQVSAPGIPGPPGPPGEDGASGGGWSHAVAMLTTPSIAAGATHTGFLPLAVAYTLQRVDMSVPARLRIYTTQPKRDADVARAVGDEPTGDHGLLLEVITTTLVLGMDLSPTVAGFDADAIPDGQIAFTITNLDVAARTIGIQVRWLRQE
jgi:hypothetical protein